MLPDFPKSRRELREQQWLYVHLKSQENSPIRSFGKNITQHEGELHSYEQVLASGTRIVTEGFNEVAIPIEVKFEDIPHLVGDKLNKRLDEIAETIAKENSGLFYKKLDESANLAGTGVSAGRKLPTKEMWLEMIQAMDIEFEPNSTQPALTFLAHPTMAEFMHGLWIEWEKDKEFKQKYKDLLARKYEDWRDRESRRKLVD